MSETPDEIENLLRQAQAAEPVVREFVAIWLESFRQEAQRILEWHRREGRALAIRGEDSEPVRQQVEERLAEAGGRLHGRLTRLIAWAKDSGQFAGE